MTTRVDMLLTAFIVIGLYQLFRWEDQLELKGLPVIIPVLLGCAVLTKGACRSYFTSIRVRCLSTDAP